MRPWLEGTPNLPPTGGCQEPKAVAESAFVGLAIAWGWVEVLEVFVPFQRNVIQGHALRRGF